MTPTQIAGVVLLVLSACGGLVYLRERWIMRRMSQLRTEQILEQWAKLERSKRGLNGRFVSKCLWNKDKI